MFYVWLVVIVLGLIAELIKPMYLFGAAFSCSAVIPFFMSISSVDSVWYIVLQFALFIIAALLLIFLLRKRAVNWLKNYQDKLKFINQTGLLIKEDEDFYCLVNTIKIPVIYDDSISLGDEVKVVGLNKNKYKIEKYTNNTADSVESNDKKTDDESK